MKPDTKDYRLRKRQSEGLSCEALHWALIENIWDDYWAAFKKDKETKSSKKAESFLKNLTAGQRAAVVVRIFDNMVRLHGWGNVISSQVFCLEVFLPEIRSAYILLEAEQFLELFDRVLKEYDKRLSEIELLEAEIKKISRKRKLFSIKPGDIRFAEDSDQFWNLYDKKTKVTDTLIRDRQRWRKKFLSLADSSETKIEINVQVYVEQNPTDFFVD